MVTQLQPDVRAYLHGGEVIKRYIRVEEVAHEYGFSVEETEYIARKEVIKLLGGVISGMNVGQPVIMQAANSEAQEPTEDVMDDADVAGLAMGWMSKGD